MAKSKDKFVLPKATVKKELKIYQDFDLGNQDFRYGFVISSVTEEGKILGEDVWCLTKNGLINSYDLDATNVLIYDTDHVDKSIITSMNLKTEVQDEKKRFLTSLFSEKLKELKEVFDLNYISKFFPFFDRVLLFGRYLDNILQHILSSHEIKVYDILENIDKLTSGTLNQKDIELLNYIKSKDPEFYSFFLFLKNELERIQEMLNYINYNDVDKIDKNLLDIKSLLPNYITKILFRTIKDIINYYVDYKDEQEGASTFYALYLMATYVYRLFNNLGYVLFWGEKRSGKTKNLNLALCIAWNPVSSGNMSPSSLFRIIDAIQPTLVLDETDLIVKHKKELHQLLLSGASKNYPVVRTEEKGIRKRIFIPQRFDIFSPKIMAGITGFDPVLEDRCIKITMVRSVSEKAYRNPEPDDQMYRCFLRPILIAWAISFHPLINFIYNTLEIKTNVLNPREIQFFKPILSLAYLCGEEIYEEVLKYLEFKSKERISEEEERSLDVLIIKILVWKWSENMGDYSITSKELSEIIKNLHGFEESPRRISHILRKLKITDKYTSMGKTKYRITKQKLESIVRSYMMKWDAILEEFEEKKEALDEIEERIAEESLGTEERCLKILESMESLFGGEVPTDDYIRALCEKLDIEKVKAEKLVEKMKNNGLIFFPRPNFVSRVK